MLHKFVYESILGNLYLYNDKQGLCGLWLEDCGPEAEYGSFEQFGPVCEWLERYFSGKMPNPAELRLQICGSDYCKRIWQSLLRIPYGNTVTYGQIAQAVGSSPRAVGGAVGRNPVSIIIPCHRVIGAKNHLTGYGGGILNKIKLLEHEGVDTSKMKKP